MFDAELPAADLNNAVLLDLLHLELLARDRFWGDTIGEFVAGSPRALGG